MKKYLILIIAIILLSGCSISNQAPQTIDKPSQDIEASSTKPIPLSYSDNNYKVYSFSPGINYLDLNFDGLDDYVFVSHINGADYYDYHTNANRDIYNFFINNSSRWNIVTKEAPNKKIDAFERDFVILELLGCNGGGILRIVQTKNNETLLVLIDGNPNEKDECHARARFDIYKLKLSGEIAGSDYIFSPVRKVVGTSRGDEIGELGDADLIYAIKEAGF